MPTSIALVGTAVVVCLLTVAYTYFGYPILVYGLSRVFGRKPTRPAVADADLPSVSLVIAAYNEAADIRQRIENALAVDYPADKYEILIASDGSTDATNAIVRTFASRGVKLLAFAERRGKSRVLNDAIPAATGDVVVLSDANTHMDKDAIRQIAPWFSDKKIGVVCGRLVLTDPVAGRNVDGIYWKYETFLKKCESRLGALLGSNGGIYAIRKANFQPIPPNTVVDDFVLPLLASERTGCKIVYDRDAVACEETPESMTSEFHRRARIGAGGFQSIGILRNMLHPRHGWVAFTFVNHKVLRWVCPFFLIGALVGNFALVVLAAAYGDDTIRALATALMLSQIAFYAAGLMAGYLPARPRFLRVFRIPAMFTIMNAALAVGFVRYVRGRQKGTWKRTARTGEVATEDTVRVALEQAMEDTARTPRPAGPATPYPPADRPAVFRGVSS